MLNKITSLLGTQVQLEEMKLENGTTIEADSFASGENVFIITEDEKVPLPIGDYTLEDGKVLIVSEEGVIGEIQNGTTEEAKEEELSDETVETGSKKPEGKEEASEEAEEPSEEAEEPKEEVNLEEEDKDEMNKIVEEVVAAVAPIIDEMKQELAYVKEELGKIKGQETEKEEMESQIKEELSTQPATAPLKHNPESKPETKSVLARENRPLKTMDRVLNTINNLK